REAHVVDERLVVRERAVRVRPGQLERDDGGVAGPVVDVVLGDAGRGVLPGRRGEHAAGRGDHPRVDRVVEDQAVRGDVPVHQPEHVPPHRGQVRFRPGSRLAGRGPDAGRRWRLPGLFGQGSLTVWRARTRTRTRYRGPAPP